MKILTLTFVVTHDTSPGQFAQAVLAALYTQCVLRTGEGVVNPEKTNVYTPITVDGVRVEKRINL